MHGPGASTPMLRRIFVGFFVVVCMLVLAGLWFFSTLDLNLHKEKIQQLVFERTGRAMSIDGAIEAKLFPWIGLTLTDVSLANAEGFDAMPFASARASDVQLELLPLVSGTFNVKWVQFDGLRLNLQVDEDGVANWEDLLATTTVVETETSQTDVLQSVEAGAPLAAALSVGHIALTDASVSWVDKQAKTDLQIAQLNLETDAIQLGSPFTFSTSFDVRSDRLEISSAMMASGAMTIDLPGNSYTLRDLEIKTSSEHRDLPVGRFDAALTGDLLVNLKSQTFDLTDMRAMVQNIPLSGDMHGTGLFEAPSFFGQLASEEFDAAVLLASVGSAVPDGTDPSLFANTRFAFSFQQSEAQILINGLQLSSADLQLNGDFQVANLAQSPVLSGTLNSNTFSPAPWVSLFGWRAADPLVMQQARLAMAVRQSGQILSLNDLLLELDDFTLNGHVEVTDIHAVSPPVVFELHGTHLDVDRYRPATDLSDVSRPAPAAPGDLPGDQLKALDINGTASFDQLSVAGLTLTDVVIPLSANQGALEITEAKAALYDGTLFNSASLDLNADQPLLKWSSNISAVQAENLLSDYLKSDSPVSGTAIVNIDVITRGVNQQQWLQAADGAVSLRFSDGAMHGLNIGREIRRAHALLNGESLTDALEDSTGFSELSISAEINDGVLRSDDLLFAGPWLSMTGTGALELSTQQVDYLAEVLVTAPPEGQGDAPSESSMASLQGLTLPVAIKGSLSDLSVDFERLVQQALTEDFAGRLEVWRRQLSEAAESQRERAEAVLQQHKEKAEVSLEENKEVVIEQIREKRQQVEDAVEAQVDEMKQSIEKGLSDLLEK